MLSIERIRSHKHCANHDAKVHDTAAAIDWYVNPIDGTRGRSGVPWCNIPAFRAEQG